VPKTRLDSTLLGLFGLGQERGRFPAAALTGAEAILFIPTPATRSVALSGAGNTRLSCQVIDVRNGGITALLAGSTQNAARVPVAVEQRGQSWLISTTPQMRRAFAGMPDHQGAIECILSHPVSGVLTFTERGLTVRAVTQSASATMIDLSALQDVDDVRILGGIEVPFGGDRLRLLSGDANVVSVEWTDMIAQEQRDIVLVIIGALSALAAASVIEAIRPRIESKSDG
jgi:hypothetical protein